jgi:peptide/nickel transport system substrate-binding protein
MMFNRRAFVKTSAAAIAAGAIPQPGFAQQTPRQGGTLVINLEPEPTGFLLNANTAMILCGQVADGLIEYDANFEPQPALAERWEISPDRKTITFHLRRGVRWHDGKPFTSADVQYTLLEVVKKLNPRAATAFQKIEAVDAPDEHTAVLRFSEPASAIWAVLSSMEAPIIPKHLFEGSSPLTNPWNGKLIGTGAFVFKEWRKGEYILLERNPDYWRASKPYLNRIRVRIINDPGARLAALETGEVHFSAFSPVSPSDVPRLRTSANLRVETGGYGVFVPVLFMDFNMERPKFKDKRVRAAIAHAIDRQALVDRVWFGLGKPATGPIPSAQRAFYTPDTTQYPFDPKKAEQLLDEAGLKRGTDGVRLSITHHTMPYGNTYTRAGEYIREALRQVGVDVQLVTLDVGQYIRQIFTERNFDTMTCAYTAGPDPQFGILRRYYTKSFEKGVPWSNGSGYSNPVLDKVIEASFSETDPAKRKAQLVELQKVAQHDLPSINLVEMQHFSVVSKRVQGLSTFPDGFSKSMHDVWLTGDNP